MREQFHLLGEQGIRAKQLLVANEQAFDAFDEGVDLGAAGHASDCRVLLRKPL
jgi:hypothetical protein